MRVNILFFLILYSSFSHGQSGWFKHIPGFHARSSLVKGDTILTTGMTAKLKSFGYKFNVFLSWNKVKGDSLRYSLINLDTLEMDSTRNTLLSSNIYGSSLNNDGAIQFLRLSDGNKKTRTFLLTQDHFSSNDYKIVEFTLDTFILYIDNVLCNPNGNIYFIRYVTVNKPQETKVNTVIMREWGTGNLKLKEYESPDAVGYDLSNHTANSHSNNSFFFKFRRMWDFRGGPEQWEDYIIKMDTLGNELWKCQPNNNSSINPVGMRFIQKPNGNFLVSWCDMEYRPYLAPPPNQGSHISQPNRNCTLWFAEIDSNGKVLWRKNQRKYFNYVLNRNNDHNLEHTKAIIQGDGIIWVGQYIWQYWHNYLLKTDFNGNPIWYREYELYPNNSAKSEFVPYDVTTTVDEGFVLTGEYRSAKGNLFSEGCQLATIIKVDSFGCLEPGCQKGDTFTNDTTVSIRSVKTPVCKVFPNPASTEITITFPYNGNFQIKLFDPTGLLIKDLILKQTTGLNVEKYQNGIYLLYILNSENGEVETHRILINHSP